MLTTTTLPSTPPPPPITSSPTTLLLTVPPYATSPAGGNIGCLVLYSSFILLNFAEFVMIPGDQIVAQGQQAVFNCQHSTAHAIGWRLNGIPLLDSSFVGVEARSTSLPGGVLNTLTIEALPQ